MPKYSFARLRAKTAAGRRRGAIPWVKVRFIRPERDSRRGSFVFPFVSATATQTAQIGASSGAGHAASQMAVDAWRRAQESVLTQTLPAYASIPRASTPCQFFLKDEAALASKANGCPRPSRVSRASPRQQTAASHARGVRLDPAPTLLLSESPRPRAGRLGTTIRPEYDSMRAVPAPQTARAPSRHGAPRFLTL